MASNKDFSLTVDGRSGLIKKIAGHSVFRSDQVVMGIGDDAAVLEKDETSCSLVSSETFIEGVEFDLSFMPFYQLGAKVVTAAVSDIYAMNGRPVAILVNLGIPNRVDAPMIDELYKGIGLACTDYECQLAGGDVTASHGALVISVTAYGEAKKNRIIYNSGAGTTDALCVTGDLGSALGGLKVLLREKRHWAESDDPVMQPDLTEWDYIVKRQLLPAARKDIINLFQNNDIKPTAMIDVSQGLIHDLKRLVNRSEKGAYIYQSAIPVDLQTRKIADEMQEDVDKYALFGGEDFELLFTLKKDQVELFAKVCKDFTVIGKITDHKGIIEMQTAEGDTIVFEE